MPTRPPGGSVLAGSPAKTLASERRCNRMKKITVRKAGAIKLTALISPGYCDTCC
jgi:hypothetical protein